MNDPEWYEYAQANRATIATQQNVLTLWNKLKDRKEHKASLPLARWEFFEQVRSTVRVYCSFSDTKPYKLALWLPDGLVLRIKPEYKLSEFSGSERRTDKDLRSIFTHVLSPLDFCKAMRHYQEEHPLNSWQLLLLELLGGGTSAN
ncbi:MAG: hypothetical protein ABI432_01535 [Flavobacteriales bacterium]